MIIDDHIAGRSCFGGLSLSVYIYIYLFIIYTYTHTYAKISTYVMWDVPLQAVPRACALHPQA